MGRSVLAKAGVGLVEQSQVKAGSQVEVLKEWRHGCPGGSQ